MVATMNPYNLLDGPARNPGGESCLSQLQICSHEKPAQLQVYPHATFAKVQRELVESECKCGRWFWVEKYKALLIWDCPKCRGVGGVRGDITRFSESSRRHLMRWCNQVRKDVRQVTFATLTYEDNFYAHVKEPERWKRDIHTFELRFRRAFPEGAYIWRLEMVPRKSGKYPGVCFPHFHLLVFGIPTQKVRPFIIDAWHDIAGGGSEEHLKVLRHEKSITPVISRKGVMSYAAKAVGSVMSSELAKDIQAAGNHIGRWWGISCRENFMKFVDEPETYEMTDRNSIEFFRYFRRKIHMKGRSPRSLVCFWDGAQLQRDILRIISPPRGKWVFDVTGRPYVKPFWEQVFEWGMFIPSSALVSSRISTLMKERKLNQFWAYKFLNLECPGLAGV